MAAWKNSKKAIWKDPSEKENYGTWKTSTNLTFVLVNKAGHMVPRD